MADEKLNIGQEEIQQLSLFDAARRCSCPRETHQANRLRRRFQLGFPAIWWYPLTRPKSSWQCSERQNVRRWKRTGYLRWTKTKSIMEALNEYEATRAEVKAGVLGLELS